MGVRTSSPHHDPFVDGGYVSGTIIITNIIINIPNLQTIEGSIGKDNYDQNLNYEIFYENVGVLERVMQI